jgi:hypothetical protein
MMNGIHDRPSRVLSSLLMMILSTFSDDRILRIPIGTLTISPSANARALGTIQRPMEIRMERDWLESLSITITLSTEKDGAHGAAIISSSSRFSIHVDHNLRSFDIFHI